MRAMVLERQGDPDGGVVREALGVLPPSWCRDAAAAKRLAELEEPADQHLQREALQVARGRR